MAKILVNYIYIKSNDKYEISEGKYVYADMRVAVLDTEIVFAEPLVVPIKGAMTVVDRKTYESYNKIFKLKADNEGKVFESNDGEPIWLPINTDVSLLRFLNGKLVLIDNEETESVEEPDKSKVKKRSKINEAQKEGN